jgi:hypothetical protein
LCEGGFRLGWNRIGNAPPWPYPFPPPDPQYWEIFTPIFLRVLLGEIAGFLIAMLVFAWFNRHYKLKIDYWSMAAMVFVMEASSFLTGLLVWAVIGL